MVVFNQKSKNECKWEDSHGNQYPSIFDLVAHLLDKDVEDIFNIAAKEFTKNDEIVSILRQAHNKFTKENKEIQNKEESKDRGNNGNRQLEKLISGIY